MAGMPEGRGGDIAKLLVIGGAVAGGGYLAYRYWYLPAKMRSDAERYLQQNSYRPDAFAALGGIACQALGAKYGLPPQASGGICAEVGAAASQLVQQLPQLVGGTLHAVGTGVGTVGMGVGRGVAGIGAGVGAATSSIAGGAASGLVQLGTVPIQVVGKTASTVYSGAKTVVTDVAKGIGSGVREVTKFFGSLF